MHASSPGQPQPKTRDMRSAAALRSVSNHSTCVSAEERCWALHEDNYIILHIVAHFFCQRQCASADRLHVIVIIIIIPAKRQGASCRQAAVKNCHNSSS